MADESPEELRKKFEELRWSHAYEEECPDCGATMLVPSLGGFKCPGCNSRFLKWSLEARPHLGFEIDPETFREIHGVMWDIILRESETVCFWCGEIYSKEFSTCPELIRFAFEYYCKPESERLPQTRRRILEFLSEHLLVTASIMKQISEIDQNLWRKIEESGFRKAFSSALS